MPFVLALACTVPASTAKAAAIRDPRQMPPGSVIDQILLHVPAGHQANVPARLDKDGTQLMPTDGNEFRLDNVSDLRLLVAPLFFRNSAELALVAYNLDAVDAHTVRAVVIGRYRHEVTAEELATLQEA